MKEDGFPILNPIYKALIGKNICQWTQHQTWIAEQIKEIL